MCDDNDLNEFIDHYNETYDEDFLIFARYVVVTLLYGQNFKALKKLNQPFIVS